VEGGSHVPTEAAAAVEYVKVDGFEPFLRTVVWDGTTWRVPDDACFPVDRPAALFGALGQIWLGWADGSTVRWRPYYAP
jgi:hypothetical protein